MRLMVGFVIAATAVTAHAQAADTAVRYSRRSPTTAALWSTVIPGSGQVYVGQTLIGFTLMGLTIGSFSAMAQPREKTGSVCTAPGPGQLCTDVFEDWSTQRRWGFAGAGLWAFSIVSAPILARDFNRRHSLTAVLSPGANGATRVGLAIRF